jgi:nitroimidazol reductase NimA-like FMN-containing flavoprotein (pyridoxamine 5'-phosphate oxidase superfamily)
LNYGYSFEDNLLVLYFHDATEGKKRDIIKQNSNVCFEIDCESRLIEGEQPCSFGYRFKSIIGFGRIIIISSTEEKRAGLNKIMARQTGKETTCHFSEEALRKH